MSKCNGYGDCIRQCICICEDDTDCKCGHQIHPKLIGGDQEEDIYCKDTSCQYNCQLVECHNYWHCKKKLPQWVLNCHNRMCDYCAVTLGKMVPGKKEDCPICMEEKDLITVTCGKHSVCLSCWTTMATKERDFEKEGPLSCPLCRKKIYS